MSNSVQFRLIGAPGGTVIDPDGTVSVVKVLFDTYGDRLDWDDLLEAFEERAGICEFMGQMDRQQAEMQAMRDVENIIRRRNAGK